MTHPMQPTNKQILEWFEQSSKAKGMNQMDMPAAHLARLAYAAGADAELEACCGWIESLSGLGGLMTSSKFRCDVSDRLRAARRPAPAPQQQALAACAAALAAGRLLPDEASIIRLALEAQP